MIAEVSHSQRALSGNPGETETWTTTKPLGLLETEKSGDFRLRGNDTEKSTELDDFQKRVT